MIDDNSVIINPSKGTTSNNKYFCSYCNTRLIPLTQEGMIGCYVCTKCTIEYWPNQTHVKKADKFDLPGPETDIHGNVIGDKDIPIAVQDNPEASSTSYKHQKLTRAYEALSRHGYKFTNYEEK